MSKHEKLLEEEHQKYIHEITESGLPRWLADQYNAGPNICLPDTNNSSLKERFGSWISAKVNNVKHIFSALFNLKQIKQENKLPF